MELTVACGLWSQAAGFNLHNLIVGSPVNGDVKTYLMACYENEMIICVKYLYTEHIVSILRY